MTIRKKIVGDGMTEITQLMFSEDDLSGSEIENLRTAFAGVNFNVREFKKQCQDILEQKGLPAEDGAYFRQGETKEWKPLTSRKEITDSRYCVIRGPWPLIQEEGFAHDSLEGFAAKFIVILANMEKARNAGDFDAGISAGMKLGQLMERARLKHLGDRFFIAGRNQSRKGLEGHERVYGTDSQKRKKRQKIFDELQAELEAGTKKTAAYQIVGQRNGVTAKTVQRAVRDYLKEKS